MLISAAATAGLGLVGLALFLALMNWACLIAYLVTRRHRSMVPLVGPVAGAVGWLILRAFRPGLAAYAWIAPVVDPSTPILLASFPSLVRQFRETSPSRLVRAYRSEGGTRRVRIALYRDNVLTVVERFDLAPGQVGTTMLSMAGTWRDDPGRLHLSFGGVEAFLETVNAGGGRIVLRDRSTSGPDPTAFSIAGLDFRPEGEADA